MTTIHHEADADPASVEGQQVAVVGYGNQGRSWALNLRDSGLDVQVGLRNDDSRRRAVDEGFAAADLEAASDADVLCLLVPDDVIPELPIRPGDDALTIVASGYTLAFDRFDPAGDQAMVARRMLGPEVRRCYEERWGFITGLGAQGPHRHRPRPHPGGRPWHRRPQAGGDRDVTASGSGARSGGRAGALSRAHPCQQLRRASTGSSAGAVPMTTSIWTSGWPTCSTTSRRGASPTNETSRATPAIPGLRELWQQHASDDIAAFELDLRRRLGEDMTPTGPAPATR